VKMTVYLPDDLGSEVKAELGDANVSQIFQSALRDELRRVRAHAEVAAKGFERIEVYQSSDDVEVAFQGRQVGQDRRGDVAAYLTPRGNIAIYDNRQERLSVVSDFDKIRSSNWPDDLLAQIAGALGERYVRELDI
jgi:hypothetical protein